MKLYYFIQKYFTLFPESRAGFMPDIIRGTFEETDESKKIIIPSYKN